MTTDRVTAERVMAASPQAIFDVLADPSKHPVIDGSGTVRESKVASTRLGLGSTFGMSMHNKLNYGTKPTVVEFEENRRIAWKNKGGPTWRYELTPEGEGTRVVETYDMSPTPMRPLLKLLRVHVKTQANMVRTLERLERFVTTGSAGA